MEKSGRNKGAAQRRQRKQARPQQRFWASSLTSPPPAKVPDWDAADPGYDEFVASVFQEWNRIHAVAATAVADGGTGSFC